MSADLMPDIQAYVESRKLPKKFERRIYEVADVFRFMCPAHEIERLFISDIVTDYGLDHDSLWGFAGPFWMEARNFLGKDSDVDVSSYWGAVKYLGMEYKNLVVGHSAFHSSAGRSELKVEVETDGVRYSVLVATGTNCDHLISIVNDLLIPNLRDGAGPA